MVNLESLFATLVLNRKLQLHLHRAVTEELEEKYRTNKK